MSALVALLLLASPHYPLATVFVRDGQLWLSELGQANEKRLESPGLIADTATLDVSRTRVAFTARRGAETHRLFLMNLGSGLIEELSTGLIGPHHAPAFSGDGKRVYFTAAPSESGPETQRRSVCGTSPRRSWRMGRAAAQARRASFILRHARATFFTSALTAWGLSH